MIAEKRTHGDEAVAISLFNGLQFPAVPRHPIKAQDISHLTKDADEELEIELSKTETSRLLSSNLASENTRKDGLDGQRAQANSANWSALYATEVITEDSHSFYPELPHIVRKEHQYSSLQPVANIASHLLSRETSSSSNTPLEGVQLTPQGASSTLVDELLQENSRLLDEVNHLKAAVQSQQGKVVQTQSSPITGLRISTPNQPPKVGVKYVCCGSCRQWLVVERNAVLVACSNCEAVNNCSLVESKEVNNGTPNSNAPTQ